MQHLRPAAAVAALRPISPTSARALMAAGLLTLLAPVAAQASRAGAGLAWESPSALIVQSLTGPIAMGVSTLAIFGTGAALIWGAEIKDFTRTIIMVGLIIAMIALAAQILAQLFGVGAVVA